MRLRVTSTLVALGAVFPMGMPLAHADSETMPAAVGAWFWSKQSSGAVPVVGLPFPALPATTLGGVDANRLAVSYQGEKETMGGDQVAKPEKETYLFWDLYHLEPGTTVDSFVFSLPLDPAAESNRFVADQPQLIACKPTGGFAEAQGDAFASKPQDECSDAVFATFDEAKATYTFDITPFAQDWIEGDNFGVGIRPRLDESVPYQLQFLYFDKAVAQLEYTLPEPEEEEYVAPEPAPVDTDLGGSFVPVPQPEPQAPAAPAPVTKPREVEFVRPVASVPFTQDTSLPFAFWVACAAAVALLAIVSLVLGDELVPSRRRTRQGTLDRVLQNRRSPGSHRSSGSVNLRPV